jgi:O-antigen ligase
METPPDVRAGMFFLWLLVLVPPFLLSPLGAESFRQPKLLASEALALASLAALAWEWRRRGTLRWAEILSFPALRLVLPALAVATAGLAFTLHPLHVTEALIDLWIGGAALVGWSAAVPASRLERALDALLVPATALAAVAILQFHDLWQPLRFLGLAPASRQAVTSLAGNPGDLGAYLVLPALLAQEALRRRWRDGRGAGFWGTWGTAAALAVCVYALLLSQTLAALAALLAGSLVLWGSRLTATGRRRAAATLSVGVVAALLLMAAVAPLRLRVVMKARQAAAGDWNSVLTGRLDGWRAAVWMFERHPLAGVGHGAYLPEFVPAKLALLDRGVRFFPDPSLSVFANAHDELLTAAAEWGVPGLLAIAWGGWVLLAALRRLSPERRPLAGAGTAALLVLALVDFPFHVALVAYPALLFLSWVLQPPAAEEPAAEGVGAALPRALWAVLPLVLILALAGQGVRWYRLSLAGRLLGSVQRMSVALVHAGQAPPEVVAQNLAALREAAALDPVEVGVPVARGGQYLFFLARPEEAELSYREALRLEPHPEAYMGLGKAQWMAGRRDEAGQSFTAAVRLQPLLARELPADFPGIPGNP